MCIHLQGIITNILFNRPTIFENFQHLISYIIIFFFFLITFETINVDNKHLMDNVN